MTKNIRVKINDAIAQLNSTFVEREEAVLCIWLALLTRSNFILVGDPGTAKTSLVMAAYSHIADARKFGMLCGAFATEDKVFGPPDIKAFQAGEYRRSIKGRLADCDLGFLDEIMKSNEGTLNGMLTAMNERTYDGQPIPLRTLGAATNWPEVKARTDNVAAMWDRLLIRCEVKEVKGEANRIKLLEAIEKVAAYTPAEFITQAELDQACNEVARVKIGTPARRSMVAIQESLEKQKIFASSRRYGALQVVLKALAWLGGRDEVKLDDFDALSFGLWSNQDDIERVRAVVEAVDHEVVSECVRMLRDATQQCTNNSSPTAVPRLLQVAAEASNKARSMLEQRGARTKGRTQIKTELVKLKEIYEQLKERAKPHLTGGKAVAPADGEQF